MFPAIVKEITQKRSIFLEFFNRHSADICELFFIGWERSSRPIKHDEAEIGALLVVIQMSGVAYPVAIIEGHEGAAHDALPQETPHSVSYSSNCAGTTLLNGSALISARSPAKIHMDYGHISRGSVGESGGALVRNTSCRLALVGVWRYSGPTLPPARRAFFMRVLWP